MSKTHSYQLNGTVSMVTTVRAPSLREARAKARARFEKHGTVEHIDVVDTDDESVDY